MNFLENKQDARAVIWKICRYALIVLVLAVWPNGSGIAGQRYVKAAGLANTFPYFYLDESGIPAGIYVNLARKIAAAAGWDLEVTLMDYVSAIEALRTGKVDLLLSVPSGDARAWDFALSEAHSVMEMSFFSSPHKEASPVPPHSDPSSLRVGVHELIADMETLKLLPGMSQIIVGDAEELFKLLSLQSLDVVLCPREIGLWHTREPRFSKITLQAQPVLSRSICFAVRRDTPQLLLELNKGMFRLKNAGEYFPLLGIPTNSPGQTEYGGIPLSQFVFPLVFTLIVLAGYGIMECRREALGKAMLWIVLAVCLAVEVSFVGVSYLQEREAAVKRMKEKLRTVAELNAMLVVRRIERAKANVQAILSDPMLLGFVETASGLADGSPPAPDDQVGNETVYALRRRLEGLTIGWSRSEAFLVNTSGLVLLSTNPVRDGVKIDGSLHLQQAGSLRVGEVYIALLQPSTEEGTTVEIYMPLGGGSLSSGGEPSACVAVLRIFLEELLYPYPRESFDMGNSGETLLFRKDGNRYVCMNSARLVPDTMLTFMIDAGLPWGMEKAIESALQGKAGVSSARDYRDIPVIFAYYPVAQPVSGITWAMIVKQDEREALEPVKRSLKHNVFLVVSYAFAVSLLGLLFTRSISRRIRSLGELTRKITDGNLDIEPRVDGNDDISRLAQSLKAMSDSLKKRLSLAEHLSGLGRLSAGMAHEVRTPLTSINVILQSLEMQLELDEDQREDFLVMRKEIDRLNDLVTRYLSFAKPPEPNLRLLELNGLLENIEILLDARIEDENIQISLDLWNGPLEILGDEAQLNQVFLNLAVNAVEAMPDGGVLTLASRRVKVPWPLPSDAGIADVEPPPCRDFIEVSISDTGQGIPEKDRFAIFDPFFTTKEGGTGLGLAIAWSIVERHLGKLLVENSTGGGCTFRVVFPLAEEMQNEKNSDRRR